MVPNALDCAGPTPFGAEEHSQFFALSLDLLCIADLEGVIRDLSASVHNLLGYRSEEIIGLPYLQLIHPDDHAAILERVETLKRGHDSVGLEFRVRCKDGTYRWMEGACPAPKGENGLLYVVCRDITETKQLQDSLLDWKTRYDAAMKACHGAVYEWNSETDKLIWGGNYEQILGYPCAEMPLGSQRWLRLVHPDDRRTLDQQVEAILQARQSVHLSYRVRHKDGRYILIRDDAQFCASAKGPRTRVVGFITDLSEQQRLEEQFRQTEQRLHQIVNNTSAVIYVKDLEGKYLLINRQYEKLFKVTLDQVLGRTVHDFFPVAMADVFRRNDQQVATSGQVLQIEEIAPHEDGPHHYISVKFPLRDTQGNLYAVAGISTDITQRVLAEREAEQLKDRLTLILNSVGDGIIGINLDQQVTFANRAAEQMLGRSSDELLGLPWSCLLAQPRRVPWTSLMASPHPQPMAGNGQQQHPEETAFARGDGSAFPVEFVSNPLQDKGQPVGAVVAFRDMTERKERRRIDQELQAARAVQGRLYPRTAPAYPGLDIAGAVFPASVVCGDYYDFMALPNDRLALMMGDVSGHGLGAALQMVEVRSFLRATLPHEKSLDTVLERLNDFLVKDLPDDLFVSLFLSLLDVRQRRLDYVGAGHDAFVLRAGGRDVHLDSTTTLLGIVPQLDSQVASIVLEPGDILLLATDGMAETFSPEGHSFRWKRMMQTVRGNAQQSATELVQTLYQQVRAYAGLQPQADDISVVLVKAL